MRTPSRCRALNGPVALALLLGAAPAGAQRAPGDAPADSGGAPALAGAPARAPSQPAWTFRAPRPAGAVPLTRRDTTPGQPAAVTAGRRRRRAARGAAVGAGVGVAAAALLSAALRDEGSLPWYRDSFFGVAVVFGAAGAAAGALVGAYAH